MNLRKLLCHILFLLSSTNIKGESVKNAPVGTVVKSSIIRVTPGHSIYVYDYAKIISKSSGYKYHNTSLFLFVVRRNIRISNYKLDYKLSLAYFILLMQFSNNDLSTSDFW